MIPPAPRGWVLYDDRCGFCRGWMTFWRPILHGLGLRIATLQTGWVRNHLDIPYEEIIDDLRLLTMDGRQAIGADAYRYVLRRVLWMMPLYLFSVAPAGRQLFDWGYAKFKRNRFRVSAACGLGPSSSYCFVNKNC